MAGSEAAKALLGRLRVLREAAGISEEELEQRLILGPGWVRRFESGATIPSVDVLLAMLGEVGADLTELARDLDFTELEHEVVRQVDGVAEGDDLLIKFKYAKHDVVYRLPRASSEEFGQVIGVLRNGLARLVAVGDDDDGEKKAIKADAVARTFLEAVRLWPHANPSDLWWFLVSRAFCDGFNHPAEFARLDLGQSWKRTSGWALEEVVVRHYGPFLAERGIEIVIASGARKAELVAQLVTDERMESDKADVLLVGKRSGEDVCFGVVHVKASFAERRTDDVPMSRALIQAGFTSPLWTMDCKSTPSEQPDNSGELGAPLIEGTDGRSAKRRDIEDDGYFSACFSYNANTRPTPSEQTATGRIHVCSFTNPDDAFSKFVLAEWARFCREKWDLNGDVGEAFIRG